MNQTGEEVLKSHLLAAHDEVNPNQALDPATIVALITAIMEAIRGCRNPASAFDHIRRGSLVAVLGARRAIANAGYSGSAFALARQLAERGKKLSDREMEVIFDDVNDIPTPPPVSGGGWPVWTGMIALLACLVMISSAEATWPVATAQPAIASVDSWPVSLPAVDLGKGDPARATATQAVQQADLVIPNSRPWTYSGDNGTRAAMIDHLVNDPNHRVDRTWLEDLSYAELKALHSADHNHLLGDEVRRPPTGAKAVSSSPPAAVRTSKPAMVQKTVRAGMFGGKTKKVWVPASSVSQVGYSSGCPGGYCPR